jgi:hypothetical protein
VYNNKGVGVVEPESNSQTHHSKNPVPSRSFFVFGISFLKQGWEVPTIARKECKFKSKTQTDKHLVSFAGNFLLLLKKEKDSSLKILLVSEKNATLHKR